MLKINKSNENVFPINSANTFCSKIVLVIFSIYEFIRNKTSATIKIILVNIMRVLFELSLFIINCGNNARKKNCFRVR